MQISSDGKDERYRAMRLWREWAKRMDDLIGPQLPPLNGCIYPYDSAVHAKLIAKRYSK